MKPLLIVVIVLLGGSANFTSLFEPDTLSGAKSKYYTEVPFEFIKEKIVIPVEINGETYRFLFDTGAPNFISTGLYESLESEIISKIHTTDANSLVDSLIVTNIDELVIGKIRFKDFNALVYDIESNMALGCYDFDGIIGSNLLVHSIVDIDLPSNTITLTNDKKRLQLNKNFATKMRLRGKQAAPIIAIDVQKNGKFQDYVLVDTGAGGLYDMSLGSFEIFKDRDVYEIIAESSGASSISLFGDVPASTQYLVRIPEIRLKNFTIENYISETTAGSESRLGAGLLKHGTMTLDFINKKFYFTPHTESVDAGRTMFGFSRTIIDRSLRVGFVWDVELRDKVEFGDEILSINGIEMTEEAICQMIGEGYDFDSNDTLDYRIRNQDGEIIDLTIRKKSSFSLN